MGENFNIIIIDEDENTGNIIKSYLSSDEKINICGVFTDYEAGLRSGYLQAQGDHAGLYKYKKALGEGKTKAEAKVISRTIGKKK